MSSRLFAVPLHFLPLLLALAVGGWAQEEVTIEMKTVAGLRFDPPRFVIKPGARVKVELENTDDMAHNFVLIVPGSRMEIVNAALTMPITPEQTFIPPSANILQHTPILIPGKSATLEFTAPATEGVYPYVCTYPGHGLVMYGAMYVTKKGEKDLPSVANDENLPDIIRDQAKNLKLHAYPEEPPYWYRIFMRESGPASIAVALPNGQNYCWDAGACRLRYAWRGAFLDPQPHWRGNGDAFAEVKGTIYYRPGVFPLRFGDVKKVPTEVRFRGYSIVEKFPEFHYDVGGVDVRESIKPAHHGGLEVTYKVSGTKSPVFFVTEAGAGIEPASSAGKFIDGVLKLPADKAKQFTVSLLEVPNKEPIGYWSMNDTLAEKKPLPVDGVKGRALIFDGKKSHFATGIKTEAVSSGATFAIWAQLTNPASPNQAYIGARTDDAEFLLGANLAGVSGFGVRVKNAKQESKITAVMPEHADGNWHHLAATMDTGKGLRFYLDGKPAGMASPAALPPETEFFLGASTKPILKAGAPVTDGPAPADSPADKANLTGGTFDEARIYGRVLDAKEIAALYESERGKAGPPKPAPAPAATPAPKTAGASTPKPGATPKASGKATPSAKPTPAGTPKPGKTSPTPKPAKPAP